MEQALQLFKECFGLIPMKIIIKIFLPIFVIFIASSSSFADEQIEVGIDEKLGAHLPLSISLNDENGNEILLGDLITEPTVLAFVYYECPGICSPLLFELANVINRSDLELGYDYNIVCISFDERENFEVASEKKNIFFSALDKDAPSDSWRFLTGDGANIKTLTDAAGFYFKREGNEFRHAGALIFIDKNGKVCRYLFPGYTQNHGFGILPFDFKMAVLETSEGKETPTIARILQFCFSYDSEGQKYAMNFTRIFGAGIILLAGIFFLIIKLKPKKKIIKAR
jgi:protein SCO1/2